MKESAPGANDNTHERVISGIERQDAETFARVIAQARERAQVRALELRQLFERDGYTIDNVVYPFDADSDADRILIQPVAWLAALDEMLEDAKDQQEREVLLYLAKKAELGIQLARYDAYEAALAKTAAPANDDFPPRNAS